MKMILREDENIKPMHYLRKSFIFFILLLFMEFSSGTDTLPSGKTLKDKDGDFLISVSKSFTLGFFSTEKSTNRYLGIYSSLDPEKRVVWVANRDKPVKDRSGVVSFIQPNYLALCVGSAVKKAIWSTTYLGAGMNNYSAQVLDTGNLVVFKDDIVFENDMKRHPLWQSFDSPTDTWLPNMKLGFSRITAAELFLTSWNSIGDPRNGSYSFKLDPIREFVEFSLFKLNGVESSRIWRTGPLNGTRLVEFPLYNFNLTYLDDENGFYMTYSMRKPSAFSYIHLNPLGLLRMSEWNPDTLNWTEVLSFRKGTCDDYNFCGPYSYCYSRMNGTFECSCFPGFEKNNKEKSRGCVRKRRDSNGCPNGEGFVKLSSMKIPDTRKTSAIEGLKDCEKECLRDCKCIAYIHATEMGFACVLWDGNLLDARKFDIGGKDLFVRIAAIELARNSSSNKKFKVAAVVTSVGVVAASIGIFILCWHNRHKRKGGSRSRKEQGPANKIFYGSELFREMEIGGEIPLVDLRFLVDATNNFSDENKLGQGGFGSVYKGTLKDGHVIAVKRLSEKSGQGLEEFKNEATLIRRLQHRNLVRLLGCCVEQEEKIVIYEFMPNKSLNSLIFDKKEGSCLDWAQRFDIIMGITRGLVYLHHDSRLKIIHRDLKASNILLDAQMNPKISDFGMARFFANDEVEAITRRIVGTYGYMSPEYAMEGICSIKSDVYSFGILLLEIVSGRKNNSFYKEESLNLVGHVWKLWCEERALELIDPSLLGDYSTKTVLRCIHVGLLSVQLNADDRPTMFEIKEMLLSNLNLPPPGEPAFISTKFDSIHASTGGFTSSSQNTLSLRGGADSVNYLTISVIVPR